MFPARILRCTLKFSLTLGWTVSLLSVCLSPQVFWSPLPTFLSASPHPSFFLRYGLQAPGALCPSAPGPPCMAAILGFPFSTVPGVPFSSPHMGPMPFPRFCVFLFLRSPLAWVMGGKIWSARMSENVFILLSGRSPRVLSCTDCQSQLCPPPRRLSFLLLSVIPFAILLLLCWGLIHLKTHALQFWEISLKFAFL